ncbi:uncharacterized protein LOC117124863 isoform X2 [Anneissia japonica]|nr:uncharacterized protein LOC117124863 isoform X2 [Anneissia japonica]
MQDPPGIPLYVVTKVVHLNGVQLNKYRCRRGSNSFEGLHAHLVKAIPSQHCGIMPFQVYLISFAMQWNCRMESLKVAGGQGRHTLCMDARQIQRLYHQANVLFGKEQLLEPNFAAPMPYPARYDDPAEKELLGVEYAYCQSSDFKAKDYFIKKVSEEQSQEEEEEESGSDSHQNEDTDEGIDVLSTNEEENDVLGSFSSQHAILTKEESVADEVSPALQDVLMSPSHLHLPGYEEVERLALLLLELADESNSHIIPVPLRQKIAKAAQEIHEHDKSSKNFVKKYKSKWGYTLFGRCLGPDTPLSSAAQKTKFGWMRYAQASQITDESRLLYLLIKILKNRPGVSHFSSPTKIASHIKGEYKRIVDRIRDDPVLYSLAIPLPKINNKSITNFITKEEKKANYKATAIPKVITHQRVLSDQPMPESPSLPTSLPQPERPQMQYTSGKRPGEKRRWTDVEVEEQPLSTDVNDQKTLKSRQSSSLPTLIPKYQPSLGAPVLMVIPSQPSASSITFKQESSSSQGLPFKFSPAPPPAPPIKPTVPRSGKPCSACKQPKCAGQRKRYTPSRDKTMYSTQKIFTFCPITKKSTTPGFEKEDFKDFDDFKKTVDEVLLLQAIDK